MVNIYIPKQSVNEQAQSRYFSDVPTGTLDVLGATFEQAASENPVASFGRYRSLIAKEYEGRRLSEREWRMSENYREGIEYYDRLTDAAAAQLAENYDARQKRNATLNRANGGFWQGAGQFGVGLAATALDPLNIGVSFIPYVGQARFAAMATKFGKTTARTVKGGTEGAIGAALVEPIVYGVAQYEQNNDYTLANSFMNVAFGGALGGGMHAVGGKIGDILKGAPRRTRESLGATAVGQAARGEEINVTPIMRADPTLRESDLVKSNEEITSIQLRVRELASQITETLGIKRKGRRIPNMLRPFMSPKEQPKTLAQFVRQNGGIKEDDLNAADVRVSIDKDKKNGGIVTNRQADFTDKRGRTYKKSKAIDDMALAAFEAGYFRERPTVAEFLDALDNDVKGRSVYSADDIDFETQYRGAEELFNEARDYGIDVYGLSDEDFSRLINEYRRIREGAEYKPVDQMTGDDVDVPDGLTEDELIELRNSQDEAYIKTEEYQQFRNEFDALQKEALEFTQMYDDLSAINEQNLSLQADVNAMAEADLIDPAIMESLAEADRLTARAENYDTVTRQAADCLGNRG